MPTTAELEFRIRPFSQEKSGHPVTSQLWFNGQKQIFDEALMSIDLELLSNLRGEPEKYDAALTQSFFKGDGVEAIKEAFDKARWSIDSAGSGAILRVRLLIEEGAEQLHHVRWECMRDTKQRPLFQGDTILFSRYLSSDQLKAVGARKDLKALIAIANPKLEGVINPEDPSKDLAPVNVPGEKARAEKGFTGRGFAVTTLASPPHGNTAATSASILDELSNGYDVLYLVCHGGLVDQGDGRKPMLWLEDGDAPVDASHLVDRIRDMANPPRLVMLASCESAGADGTRVSASGTLGALGPLLAKAGVPAVIAMQGNIRMDTIERFMPVFFTELAKDGQIDRAMGKARGSVSETCLDYWMPTLFMRLSDGQLWGPPDAAEVAAERLAKVVEFQEQQIKQAQEEQRVAKEEARAARDKQQEWADKYIKLMEDVAARGDDSGESSVAALLESGDLTKAAAQLEAQINGWNAKQARAYYDLGRVGELRYDWDGALACYLQAWEFDPNETEYGFQYAMLAQKQDRLDEAIDTYQKLLPALTSQDDIATTLNNLSAVYARAERFDESEGAAKKALVIARQLAKTDPDTYLPDLADSLNNLASLYSDHGRLDEAEPIYQEVLVIRRNFAKRDPAHLPGLGMVLNNLGLHYRDAQKPKEAEVAYTEALVIRRELAKDNPEDRGDLAMSLKNLADLLSDTERTKEAEALYQEALAVYREVAQVNPEVYLPDVADTLTNLAILYSDTQRLDEAETAAREAADIVASLWKEQPEEYGDNIAEVWLLLSSVLPVERKTEAVELLRHAKDAAVDPELKDEIEQRIDTFKPGAIPEASKRGQ